MRCGRETFWKTKVDACSPVLDQNVLLTASNLYFEEDLEKEKQQTNLTFIHAASALMYAVVPVTSMIFGWAHLICQLSDCGTSGITVHSIP